jgi:hypothetical protein
MDIELGTLLFANLLEIARLSAIDGYKRQGELIEIFRERDLPFVAIMPYRHRCRCAVCGIERGESMYHFENPSITCEKAKGELMWGPPKGLWYVINTTELHAILTHGAEPNKKFKKVIESVYCKQA